jgi:hypothetical protein
MKGCNGDEAEGLESLGVDCVVVDPSYGRVLQPVSNKDSLRPVKLSAGTNVISLSGVRKSISTRPLLGVRPASISSPLALPRPLLGLATHLPLFDMQTAGCAAKGLFASEITTNMMRLVVGREC